MSDYVDEVIMEMYFDSIIDNNFAYLSEENNVKRTEDRVRICITLPCGCVQVQHKLSSGGSALGKSYSYSWCGWHTKGIKKWAVKS